MRLYETTLITSSQLDDSELDKEIRTVEDLIKSNGGSIVQTQRWGVRRFAYEIAKQKQGHYTHFLYEAEPGVPAALATSFKVNERIMRYLTVKSLVNLEELQQEATEGDAAETQSNATESTSQPKESEESTGKAAEEKSED